MAILPIFQHPNKDDILRKKSVEAFDLKEAEKISKNLIDTLNNSKIPGAGLSAPQIGINKRIFIARKFFNEDENNSNYIDYIIINPILKNKSKEKTKSLEACLSIDDAYGFVERYKKVGIVYTNLDGKKQILKTGGFLSCVIQHELDHLNGILFIDKLIDNKIYTEKEIDAMYKKKEVKAE